MPSTPISLNKLLILAEILDSGSVTAAARRLNRTQPSLSKALGDLRIYYDDRLLIRDGSGLSPTPFAERLMRALSDWRNEGEALLSMRSHFDPGRTVRHFMIRASDYHLMAVGPALQDIALRTGLTLTFEIMRPAGKLDEDYRKRAFDFAFQVNASVPEGFSRQRILSEPYVILFDPAFRDAPRNLDAFCAAVFVLASPPGSMPSVVDQYLEKAGRSRQIGFRVPQVSDVARFVAGSPYLSVVPESVGLCAEQTLSLKTVDLFFEVPPVTSYLVWPNARGADPAIGWLRGKIMSAVGSAIADNP